MKDKLASHLLLACVLGFVIMLAVPTEVQASNWDFEETDVPVLATYWYAVQDTFSQSDVFSGYMETASDSETVDFFICNQYNYDEWSAGRTASVYQQSLGVSTKQFSFTIPTADTWHAVFSNVDGSSTVTLDVAADTNVDHSPWYDSTMYDTVVNGEVLLPGWHYYVSDTYDAGTTLFGHVSTWFSSDGVDVFFCDETNYDLWYNGLTATRYSLVTGMHTTSIGDFAVPYDAVWYLVILSDESDALTISFGYDYALPGTGINPQMLMILGAIGVVAVLGIAGVAISRSRKHKVTPQPTKPDYTYVAKVLVVCPYCGGKNEQGMTKCAHCSAEI